MPPNTNQLPRKPITIVEHGQIAEQDRSLLQDVKFVGTPSDYMAEPVFLGIRQDFYASYYIGAEWLIPDELAVVVLPKMDKVDFVQMFLAALKVDTRCESDYFSKCYGIKFNEPIIETTEHLNQLTPLLVLHFVSLLDRLVKRGLKKNYIIREENLKSKVKGRIMLSKHLQKNEFPKRSDRMFCRFQEYTDDIPENRLLKRALLFCENVINGYESLKKQKDYSEILLIVNRLKSKFSLISDDIQPSQVRELSGNKLFKEYKDAIRVAKMLLRRFDYSISNASVERNTTPPFWIDMARLYEMWVWKKLTDNSLHKVLFQESGFYGRQVADFVVRDEKLILDAKYKLNYANDNFVNINDIREISGNARDESLLPNIPDDYSPRCVIIYPGDNDELKNEAVEPLDKQGVRIPHYRNFYKISIPLPEK